MFLRPVVLDESLIGQALPWDVYNASGVLLAAEGLVIADREQFLRLTAQSQFVQLPSGRNQTRPSEHLHRMCQDLQRLLADPAGYRLEDMVRRLVEELLELYEADPDACLGLARVMGHEDHSAQHGLLTAIVVTLLGTAMDLPEDQLASTVAAAMTMNIAAPELHNALAKGSVPLDAPRRAALHKHPEEGARLLERCGVADPVWIEAVRQHHENMDSSGYPNRLDGPQIALPARIIRIADFYCAKLTGRHYRPPKSPEFALRTLFGHERGKMDSQIATLLLRKLGIYPPGSLVRLNNHEIAVVTRRSHSSAIGQVISFVDPRGHLLSHPKKRDIALRHFAIHGVVEPPWDWPEIHWDRLWGY